MTIGERMELKALRKTLTDLAELVRVLAQRIEALEAKRGPGRPRKAEE